MLVLVTGSNGNIGQRLVGELNKRGCQVRAAVRSPRAAAQVADKPDVEVVQVDYNSVADMRGAMAGADVIVHLVGILKETKDNSYEDAHERTAQTLVDASADSPDKPNIVYLSIVGSAPGHTNACLASKGKAESILLNGFRRCSILQVPMVLGEDDYASFALRKRAGAPFSVGFRLKSLEQPIYAGDVVNAICQACETPVGPQQLAGPESLSRRQLTQRAAQQLGKSPLQLSLPISLGYAMCWLLERMSASPPLTRAMLEVLDHDDAVEPATACVALDLTLTPLDETLSRTVAGASSASSS